MSVRTDYNLWVVASITKHFKTILSAETIYAPGEIINLESKSDWFDLKINTVNFAENSNNLFYITAGVDLLIATALNTRNIYQEQLNVQKGLACFTDIDLYKYVSGGNSFVGKLKLMPLRGGEPLRTVHYGHIDKDINFKQSVIYSKYEIVLPEETTT